MKNIFLFLILTSILFSKLFSQNHRNVLMIVLDDMNDYIGAMGGHPNAQTPNMDRLAKNSVLFANAHTNVGVCSPSRASFMTGVHPLTSGCWGFNNWMDNPILKNNKTMGEYAIENGYLAINTGKVLHNFKPYMWSERGVLDDYGPLPWNGKKTVIHPSNPVGMAELGALDATFAPLSDVPQIPGYESWYNTKGKKTPFRYVNDDDRDLLTDEKSAAFVAKRLKELEQTPDKPFLIACGFIRPHTPLVVPQKYFDMFPVEDIELPPLKENDRADFGGVAFKGAKSRGQMAYDGLLSGFDNKETALKTYIQAYLASVKFADDQIGKVLDALEKSAFKDNTVVLLFSDHGYHIGEKEELWKYTLWEEGTRIPLMISDPFNKEHHGSVVSHPVSLVDVFPTIKDLCDWTGDNRKNEGGASLDGSSLKPFLENPNVENWSGPDVAISVTASWKSKAADKQHLAARSENFRYIHYYDGSEELYDHRNDPHEWDNQAKNPEFSPVLEKMKSKLFAEVKKLEKPKPVTKTVQNNQAGDENEWKDKYFKEHPEADTNKDGKLSWPELKTHQKKSK